MGQFLQTIKKRFLKLKDDLHSGIKNGALDIAGAGIINRILMFLTTVVITRVLSKQDYGVYSYSFNFISFVALFCSLGMNAVMLQYASEQKDENKRDYIYKFTFELGLISCFLFSVLVVVYSLVFKEKISGINHTIRQFSFILIFQFFYQSTINYYRSELVNNIYRRITNINSIVLFSFSCLGAVFFSITGTIMGRYIGYAIASLYGFIKIGPRIKSILAAKKYDGLNIKSIVSYGLTITLTNAISQILYSLDVLIVGSIQGTSEAIADYKTATIIPFALAFIPLLVITFIYPHFARKNDDVTWIKEHTLRIVVYMMLLNLVVSALGIVFAPLIIRLSFGSEYLASVQCFRILMVSYFFSGSFRVLFGNILFIIHKVKVNLIIGIIDALANIVLDIVLIRKWGSVGAAYATLIITILSSLLSGIYLFSYFAKAKKQSRSYFLKSKEMHE